MITHNSSYCRWCHSFSITNTYLSCQLYSDMSSSTLFFSIIVVIFYCPLNKLLLTVAKHLFPYHGLNSHFCSKIPTIQSLLQDDYLPPFIFAIRVSYQLGPELPLKAINSVLGCMCVVVYAPDVKSLLGSSSRTGPCPARSLG